MIKILYIVSRLRRGGPTSVLYNTVKYLDQKRYKPVILTLSKETANSAILDFKDLGIDVVNLDMSRVKSFYFANKFLKERVSNIAPRIIHTHGFRADILAARLLTNNYLCCCTIHNYPYNDYISRYGKIVGSIMSRWHIKNLKRIPFPIVCSKSVKSWFEPHGLRAEVIQNGVNADEFSIKLEQEKKRLKKKLGLPDDKKIIISVGHLSPIKDPETIIKGFLISRVVKNTVLVFLGDGKKMETCKELVNENKNVKFVGRVNNVAEYLACSDFFISSSLHEGLPNAVMEAMASGLPVLLSNIKPHKEILGLNPYAGMTFEKQDPSELSEKLNTVVEKSKSDYLTMSRASRMIIDRHLNARNMSDQYAKLYDNMLNHYIANNISY